MNEYNDEKLSHNKIEFIGYAEGNNGETMVVYRDSGKLYVKSYVAYFEYITISQL